jgi:hypothetical protein
MHCRAALTNDQWMQIDWYDAKERAEIYIENPIVVARPTQARSVFMGLVTTDDENGWVGASGQIRRPAGELPRRVTVPYCASESTGTPKSATGLMN